MKEIGRERLFQRAIKSLGLRLSMHRESSLSKKVAKEIKETEQRLSKCRERWEENKPVRVQESVGRIEFEVGDGGILDPDGEGGCIGAADQEEETNWRLLTDGGGDTDELMEMRFW